MIKLILAILFLPTLLFSQGVDFEKFKGTPIKATFVKEISDERMFIYVDNGYDEAKNDTELIILKEKLNITQETFSPIYRYSYTEGITKVSILKYKVLTSSKTEKIFTDLFIKASGKWELVSDVKIKSKNVFYEVLNKIPLRFYKELRSSSNNPTQKEINTFKNLIRDSITNIIDIKKLAKVLEENKAILSKYLDE